MITINPETLLLSGLPGNTLTADEFAQLEPPPCPVCGAAVQIDRVDVTFNEDDLRANGRTYIAGMWHCPRGCNPRTGQRMHYSQSAELSIGDPGIRARCSCGDEAVLLSQAEEDAWRAIHRPPQRPE